MLVTVFLTVLIIALALGNIFLSLAKPRQQQLQLLQQEIERPTRASIAVQGANSESSANFEELAREEKINYLNRRINRLEGLLLRVNNAEFLGKKLNGTKLFQRINDLEEFRQNAKLEIAAIKQNLAKVQTANNSNPAKKQKPRESQKEEADLNAEQMHDIIYRAKK